MRRCRNGNRGPPQQCFRMAVADRINSGPSREGRTLPQHTHPLAHRKGQKTRSGQPSPVHGRCCTISHTQPHLLHPEKIIENYSKFLLHCNGTSSGHVDSGHYWRECQSALVIRHQRQTADCPYCGHHCTLHSGRRGR